MDFIKSIIKKKGPDITDHDRLKNEIERIGSSLGNKPELDQHKHLLEVIAPVLTLKTMQGFAYLKPHGYAGDFEIIDRIYTEYKTEDENFRRWDEFFHAQEAPRAVRNRKTFFLNTLNYLTQDKGAIKVLNVGSGPGRDIFEFFNSNPESGTRFECVEYDKKAIAYATGLCAPYIDRITFNHTNIFKFSPAQSYDVVWSAGLFDYMNDKRFVFLLKKLYNYLAPGGYLYIGNFSDENPTKKYMEIFGNWHLIHRSKTQLHNLALQAGIDPIDINIASEPLGINLFLILFKPDYPSSNNERCTMK